MPPGGRPAVSVVITNHNYGRFLADAVETALHQDDWTEVIVVDDGSTDDSREVIGGLDRRVRSILKENGGQGSAVNVGFAASVAPVVVFLDADDLLEPDAASTLTSAFVSGAVHVHWQLRVADAKGCPVGELRPRHPARAGDLRDEVVRFGPGHLQVTPTSGNAYSRRFLDSALPMPTGPYRTGGCDLYLCWLAAVSGPVADLGRPLSRYRRHGQNDNISGSTDVRIDRGLGWAREGFAALVARLGMEPAASSGWADHEWWHQADAARTVVNRHVPIDASLLVVDDYLWALRDTFAGRRAVQLAADDPGDADGALVERTRRALADGTSYLAVAPFCRWWFEHFPRWARWVDDHAIESHVEPAATVFLLQARP